MRAHNPSMHAQQLPYALLNSSAAHVCADIPCMALAEAGHVSLADSQPQQASSPHPSSSALSEGPWQQAAAHADAPPDARSVDVFVSRMVPESSSRWAQHTCAHAASNGQWSPFEQAHLHHAGLLAVGCFLCACLVPAVCTCRSRAQAGKMKHARTHTHACPTNIHPVVKPVVKLRLALLSAGMERGRTL